MLKPQKYDELMMILGPYVKSLPKTKAADEDSLFKIKILELLARAEKLKAKAERLESKGKK